MTHYLLWRNRGTSHSGVSARLGGRLDLDTPDLITRAWHKINEYAEDADLDVNEKDALASDLATALGEDYAELKRSRLLQIMNREELEAVCAAGVDIQLHTHRHRSPNSRELYMQELTDNQQRIIELTGCRAVHFCYPSGVYSPDFVSWLKELGVQSATTCDAGLVDIRTSLLLLPRVLDSEALSDLEFEGWVSGFWPALRH
jgi:peptidoglycan/xylan/chitin deacetylase (PgdA/CDA1 family)